MTDAQIVAQIAEAHAWLDGNGYCLVNCRTEELPATGQTVVYFTWACPGGETRDTRRVVDRWDAAEVAWLKAQAELLARNHSSLEPKIPEWAGT